jgi:HKD family nuclease
LAHYLDTGANDSSHSLGHWLNVNLVSGIREFHAQFAYFTFSALKPYAEILRNAVLAGFSVHLVLGSNEKSLVVDDLWQVLRIVENAPNASVTVVAYSNAKFHPKTVQIVHSDNSAVAIVGSGNFTHRGLGWNVEAAITLDTREGDTVSVLKEVASAIDRWRVLRESGVFPIDTEADIQALLSAGIISLSTPPRQPSTIPTVVGNAQTSLTLGSRQRLWVPPVPVIPIVSPETATVSTLDATGVTPAISAPIAALPPQKWYKLLKASDAQQNAGHKIAQLRLTKSVFAIDFRRFFRYDLFGALTWTVGRKNIHSYEYAEAAFDVQLPGKSMGVHNLQLHYAPHQEQSQNNYTSVLYWDEALKQELRNVSYVGYWVIIERDALGAFSLTIQIAQP